MVDNHDKSYVSEHTESMRRAFQYCHEHYWQYLSDLPKEQHQQQSHQNRNPYVNEANDVVDDDIDEEDPIVYLRRIIDSRTNNDDSMNHHHDRLLWLYRIIMIHAQRYVKKQHMAIKRKLKQQSQPQLSFSSQQNDEQQPSDSKFATIDIIESIHDINPYRFRYQYRYLNRPCLLRNGHEYFFPKNTNSAITTSFRDNHHNTTKHIHGPCQRNNNNHHEIHAASCCSCFNRKDNNASFCHSNLSSHPNIQNEREGESSMVTTDTAHYIASEWIQTSTISRMDEHNQPQNQREYPVGTSSKNGIINRSWFYHHVYEKRDRDNPELMPVVRQQQQKMKSSSSSSNPETRNNQSSYIFLEHKDHEDDHSTDHDKEQQQQCLYDNNDKKIKLTMLEWIKLLECHDDNNDKDNKHQTRISNNNANRHHRDLKSGDENYFYYVKDWHFQSWYEKNCCFVNKNDANNNAKLLLLYNDHDNFYFQYDLLNQFLLQYTNGDYRFVYWGQAHTRTNFHSDVLNSYSWSYNVCGTKQWTFYFPISNNNDEEWNDPQQELHQHYDKNNDDDDDMVRLKRQSRNNETKRYVSKTVIQQTNEIIFVPSGLKHSVINLEETLSINHNWITTDNILYFVYYQCIKKEISCIDDEMDQWKRNDNYMNFSYILHNYVNNSTTTTTTTGKYRDDTPTMEDWEQKENMLRGCIGLDITTFVFMTLTRLIDLQNQNHGYNILRILRKNQQQQSTNTDENAYDDAFNSNNNDCKPNTENPHKNYIDDDDFIGTIFYYYYDTLQLLRLITILYYDNEVHLQERLVASLASHELAIQTMNIIQHIIHHLVVF